MRCFLASASLARRCHGTARRAGTQADVSGGGAAWAGIPLDTANVLNEHATRGDVAAAKELFRSLHVAAGPAGLKRPVWNTVLKAFANAGDLQGATEWLAMTSTPYSCTVCLKVSQGRALLSQRRPTCCECLTSASLVGRTSLIWQWRIRLTHLDSFDLLQFRKVPSKSGSTAKRHKTSPTIRLCLAKTNSKVRASWLMEVTQAPSSCAERTDSSTALTGQPA
eukprot:TRINITY_DN108782_c0_g1_i1.p1 TRINITY_DN108782_c0_g1~~TRINITY_DN108782_c0_g1_i1.p1  ORF type:complete len:223 (-),score=33.95 TRINITY_DN108782_c0_g1_i1:90-758(-)